MKIKWGLLSMLVSGIGIVLEYMADKEECDAREQRIGELELRVQQLENTRSLETEEQ